MSDTMRVFSDVILTPAPWMQDALCAQTDPDLFFPPQGSHAGAVEAIAVCQACDVREQCLAYALTHGEKQGIWGGKTPKQRRRMPHPRVCRTCGVSIDGTPGPTRYCPAHKAPARKASQRAYQARRAS